MISIWDTRDRPQYRKGAMRPFTIAAIVALFAAPHCLGQLAPPLDEDPFAPLSGEISPMREFQSRAEQLAKFPIEDASENPDVEGWIGNLASPSLAVRQAATESLTNAGPRVMAKLRFALVSDDAEVRARAQVVAQTLERRAIVFLTDRGITVHERMGTADSVTIKGARDGGRRVIEEDEMRHITCLYRLASLNVERAHVDDTTLEYVGRLFTVETLRLDSVELTDADLTHFRSLPSLKSLMLYNTAISGKGIGALAGNDSLKSITILGAPLRDDLLSEGIRALAKDTSIEYLGLMRCPISDAPLVQVSRIESLVTIDLSGTSIGDEGVRQLSVLRNLQKLHLWNTSITDASIPYLLRFPKLQFVSLGQTKATVGALLKLKESRTLQWIDLRGNELRRAEALLLLEHFSSGVRVAIPTDAFLDREE